jgi:hypothetical protein
MADIPEPFSGIVSYASALNTVNGLRGTYTTVSRYPSFLQQFPDNYDTYIDKINQIRDSPFAQKSAVSADMIKETLKDACSAAAQFYCISGKFVTTSFSFFSRDPSAAALVYDRYIPPNTRVEDPEEINLYNLSVTNYRNYLAQHGLPESPEMQTKQGEASVVLNAQGELVSLQRMLASMIAKREDRLEAPGAGALHLQEVRAALAGDLGQPLMLSFPKPERRQPGFGYTVDENGAGTRVPGGRALLLSSAVTKDTQMRGNLKARIEEYLRMNANNAANYQLFSRVIAECNAMMNPKDQDAGAGAGFLSQRSNIDPLWFTFYMAFTILKLSVKQFYDWQSVIWGVCRKIRKKTNMKALLRQYQNVPGITIMLQKISRNTEIYTAPWVLHSSRIYDIAAVIGPCDSKNARATINDSAVSLRYFFNINPVVRGLMRFIVSLNVVEITADPQSEINQSEKILQQFILGRDSPLANTNNLTGNALNVRIIG